MASGDQATYVVDVDRGDYQQDNKNRINGLSNRTHSCKNTELVHDATPGFGAQSFSAQW